MQIQELNKWTSLFDTYGKLLSNKQFLVFDKYLNEDISESELAELENGSRQSIHDAITKAKKQLLEFEEKCHIAEKKELLRNKLEKLKSQESITIVDKNTIDEIINEL